MKHQFLCFILAAAALVSFLSACEVKVTSIVPKGLSFSKEKCKLINHDGRFFFTIADNACCRRPVEVYETENEKNLEVSNR